MDHISAGLLITLLTATPSPTVTPSHGLAVSASREITRRVRTMPLQSRESRRPGQTQPPPKEKRWVGQMKNSWMSPRTRMRGLTLN